jgi:hypothetical protein
MCISTTQVSSVMLRSKKLEIRGENVKTERAVGWKPNRVPNPSKDRDMSDGDNPSFWDEFIRFTFFLTVWLIFVF